ncbi:unnamed protein product [Mytilus edulis]|uniref:Uncharacterized protein n=1 Tax=Mytilus edulis TaxID=6550 RepID=A0A8S3UCE4_MYTED|nr:unnamed protein product [Mytilus edulis]
MSVYVIICVRNNILRNICTDLKEFELFSEIDELIVNISDTDYLSYEDKKMLLTTYLDTLEDIDTNQLREEILKVQCPFAFPLCCRKFVNKPAYLSYGSNFFKQPIGVVLPVIERLCKYDKYLLVLFALILFSDLQTVNIEDIYITSIDEDRKIEQLNPVQLNVDQVLKRMKQRCLVESTPVPTIYVDELVKLHNRDWDNGSERLVHSMPTFTTCKTSLYTQRSKTIHQIPNSMNQQKKKILRN